MKNYMDWFENLTRKLWFLRRNTRNLRNSCFPCKTLPHNSLVALYNGFPNYETMMVLYDFLDPGDRDDVINIINGCLGTPGQ